MRKYKLMVALVCAFGAFAGEVYASSSVEPNVIEVDASKVRFPVAPDLWGIFFEDIGLSLDGGLYAELVRNRSFEDVKDDKGTKDVADLVALDYWNAVGNAQLSIDTSKPSTSSPFNRKCCRVDALPGGGLANDGYFGIAAKKGAKYRLSVALRGAVKGPVEVSLASVGVEPYARAEIPTVGAEWKTYTAVLEAKGTDATAKLVFRAPQGGTFFIDCVSLFPEDTYGATGLFRKDLMERLAALKPAFVRFPGGSWVNGHTLKTGYLWKTTLGPVWDRKPQWNIWGYTSTHGVGFHEYLLLCEELKAKPLFCCYCGVDCNMNAIPLDQMGPYVQDVLDAIEYANGPVTSEWGRKRAEAGHPEPFNLEYLEIGNELNGKVYEERYALIHDAVQAKYPQLKLLSNATNRGGGSFTHGAPITGRPQHIRDEHFYKEADWYFSEGPTFFDSWPRGKFEVFVGEYACCAGAPKWGALRSAISEAAFMTGFERNADLVKLAAYAPLFANSHHVVWQPNLIYITSDGNFLNPSWYVQKLFSENRGKDVLSFAQTGRWMTVKNGKRCRAIACSAVRDADGSVIVKLVNCSAEPQPCTVKVTGGAFGSAEKTVFTGPDARAGNSPTNREIFSEKKGAVAVNDGALVETLPPLSLTVYRVDRR